MIHPTAVIDPKAQLHETVKVGPYAVIDAGVRLGPGNVIGPHVHMTGETSVGSNNTFHAGCVIGDAPQDLKYKGAPTGLEIGDGNVFREHVTVHRSNKREESTRIGSHNFLMAHSHVGHNASLADYVILANGALVGGHAEVAERAFISGTCMLHQFVRVGKLSLMQGGAGISKDLPPFCVARGDNGICGLNVVGLRRNGYTAEQRQELKQLYHLLFRNPKPRTDLLEAARRDFQSATAQELIDFLALSRRGVCTDTTIIGRRGAGRRASTGGES